MYTYVYIYVYLYAYILMDQLTESMGETVLAEVSIYIYIYMCVCVSVLVTKPYLIHFPFLLHT